MADRDATWTLALKRDPGAKAEARAFSGDVVAENKRMNDTLLRNAQELERKKSALLKRELALRTQAEIQAMREQETAGRASLARRLADYKRMKAEEARTGGGIVGAGGLGTAPRTMGGGSAGRAGRAAGGLGGSIGGSIGSEIAGSIPSTGNTLVDSGIDSLVIRGIQFAVSKISVQALGAALKNPISAIVVGGVAAIVGSYEFIRGGGSFKKGTYGFAAGQKLLEGNRAVAGAFDTVFRTNTRKDTDLGKLEESNKRLAAFEAKSLAYQENMARHDENINNKLKERKGLQEQLSKEYKQWERSEAAVLKAGRERIKQEQEMLKARADGMRTAIKHSQEELKTAQSRLAVEKQTLSAALQRFGAMDAAGQADVLAAVKKARAGGKLDQSELSALSALGTKEADRIVQQQNLRNVGGDRSNELAQLSAIAMQRRNLLAERAKIERDAPDDYDAQGNIVGKLVGRKRSQQYSAIDERVKQLNDIETRIRTTVDADSALRRSLFAGERSDIAQAGRQATTIQARVNHQISVVNKFEFSAKQIAEQATQEMIKSLKPFMTDVDKELRMLSKTIEQFRETRRQAAAKGV